MTVRGIRPFSLSLASPLATAAGDIGEREGYLVRVDLAGTTGTGEATPLPGWTESRAACERALARALEDGTPPDPETPAARHAVTLAYRDAFARRRGASVAASLARGAPAESVPVNATVGDADTEETVAAAEEAVRAGYRTLKLKVGARSVQADIERVRAVRAAVPESVRLRADANGAWTPAEAERALSALADLVEYVEQPLPAGEGDLAAHAGLRGPERAPVALDESLSARGVGRVLAAGAADAVVLKPMALGGPSRALAAGRAAAAAGVTPVVTTTVDAAVARTAAVHVAAALPDGGDRAHGLATGDLLAADLFADPAPVANGRVAVPAGPGLAGETFDP